MLLKKKKKLFKYLSGYLFLWIMLFEFILPVNNIFPKPSTVIQSFPDLVTDYALLPNYISTVAVIYLAMILAYYSIKYLSYIPKKRAIIDIVWSVEWFTEYIPGIILGIFLLFWFPPTEYVEFGFAFLTAFFQMLIKQQNAAEKVPTEYILASRSLGLGENMISRKVVWKFVQSELLNKMGMIHFNLWLILIAFEFLKGGYGIGNIFQRALEFKDLSAFFSTAVITGLTIFSGTSAINYIRDKIIFWK